MTRAYALKKLLALGPLLHGEIVMIMGGKRDDVDAALKNLLLSGKVVRLGRDGRLVIGGTHDFGVRFGLAKRLVLPCK